MCVNIIISLVAVVHVLISDGDVNLEKVIWPPKIQDLWAPLLLMSDLLYAVCSLMHCIAVQASVVQSWSNW